MLTSHNSNGMMAPDNVNEGGVIMRGNVYEYRPGHWRVCIKGIFIYRQKDGTLLYSEPQARRLLEHVNYLIDNHQFDPGEWRKDIPYAFDDAMKVYLNLGPGGREWKHTKNWLPIDI